MTIDIPTLITKLRNAPQKLDTFGRGDPKPVDEFAPLMTGDERDWLIEIAELSFSDLKELQRLQEAAEATADARAAEIERMRRASGEG